LTRRCFHDNRTRNISFLTAQKVLCYDEIYFYFIAALRNIPPNARWSQNGIIVAGGQGRGTALNQLHHPCGLYVDDDQTVLIADHYNHRIMEWKCGATSGQVVAGGNGPGNRHDQLYCPSDIIIDKETDSLIICDRYNRRVMRWSRRSGTSGEVIIEDISCFGLVMDDQRFLYVSDYQNHEVRQYRLGETNGTVVASNNGKDDRFDQLSHPHYVFVDRDHSVYVSDNNNHRVMQWTKNTKEGIAVAGGRGKGNDHTQLSCPAGVFVDSIGTVYVADYSNHRVMRWCKGATQGDVIVGGNDEEQHANQSNCPVGLSFDICGNLYVADWADHRVKQFLIETS
jgi:sugar lactone lactonase YvrE